jgi:hypothetical protein
MYEINWWITSGLEPCEWIMYTIDVICNDDLFDAINKIIMWNYIRLHFTFVLLIIVQFILNEADSRE